MSVILFSTDEVYKQMADAYEGLKHFQGPTRLCKDDDERFYKSLRRLYFANVASYLCQYHDDTQLSKEELAAVDPFQELTGTDLGKDDIEDLCEFLCSWGELKYNLVTNDGEAYRPVDAYVYIEWLVFFFSREVAKSLTKKQE